MGNAQNYDLGIPQYQEWLKKDYNPFLLHFFRKAMGSQPPDSNADFWNFRTSKRTSCKTSWGLASVSIKRHKHSLWPSLYSHSTGWQPIHSVARWGGSNIFIHRGKIYFHPLWNQSPNGTLKWQGRNRYNWSPPLLGCRSSMVIILSPTLSSKFWPGPQEFRKRLGISCSLGFFHMNVRLIRKWKGTHSHPPLYKDISQYVMFRIHSGPKSDSAASLCLHSALGASVQPVTKGT